MTIAIVNGHVIDPTSGTSAPLDVLIAGKKVRRVGKGLKGDQTIDA